MNSPIIKLMKQIGLNVNEKRGVCRGITMMAIQAYLQGSEEYQCYSDRFEKIIQESAKSSNHCEEHKAPDWDIQAFLQGIALYQLLNFYPALFPFNKSLTLLNVEEIAAVAQSKLIEQRGGIRRLDSFSGLYDDEEMDKYLQSYQQAVMAVQIDGIKMRCALSLCSHNHAIMLTYDGVYSVWHLQNHDNRHEFKDIKSVIECIKAAYSVSFPDGGALILSTEVFSLAEALSLENRFCGLWRNNADWKRIHEVTEEKAKISGPGGSWLYLAAKNNHLDLVIALLKGGADPNTTSKNGGTPLFVAAQGDHLDVLKALLDDERTDPNAARKNDYVTPLFMAAKKGHLDVLKALLDDERTDPNVTDKNGATPLFMAVKNGHTEVVTALLDKEADVFRTIQVKTDVLYQLAISHGKKEEFLVLKEKLSSKDKIDNFSLLDAALFSCHSEIAMTLISAGAQINQEHTLLFWEWLYVASLHSSNQEVSESYEQLKKSFENLINQYKKNKFILPDTSCVVMQMNSKIPTMKKIVSKPAGNIFGTRLLKFTLQRSSYLGLFSNTTRSRMALEAASKEFDECSIKIILSEK